MNYYFYNTDAGSLVGSPRFHKLIQHDFAATGGPRRFGEQLGQFTPGDKCVDEAGHEREYRIHVCWRGLSGNPMNVRKIRERLGYTPRGAVRTIVKRRAEVERMIDEL